MKKIKKEHNDIKKILNIYINDDDDNNLKNFYEKLTVKRKISLYLILYHNIFVKKHSNLEDSKLEEFKKDFRGLFLCIPNSVNKTIYENDPDFYYFNELTNIYNELLKKKDIKTNIYKEKINNLNINGLKIEDSDNKEDIIRKIEDFINLKEISTGGYNNKLGNIDYNICKCNIKINLKKVSAKSAREAGKIIAKKALAKSNKKSIKFSLKRLIGKKEKIYNYEASIRKDGKIVIRNQ